MEWLSAIRGTIEYIESHLDDDITLKATPDRYRSVLI